MRSLERTKEREREGRREIGAVAPRARLCVGTECVSVSPWDLCVCEGGVGDSVWGAWGRLKLAPCAAAGVQGR